jgi:hypothetical protein
MFITMLGMLPIRWMAKFANKDWGEVGWLYGRRKDTVVCSVIQCFGLVQFHCSLLSQFGNLVSVRRIVVVELYVIWLSAYFSHTVASYADPSPLVLALWCCCGMST